MTLGRLIDFKRSAPDTAKNDLRGEHLTMGLHPAPSVLSTYRKRSDRLIRLVGSCYHLHHAPVSVGGDEEARPGDGWLCFPRHARSGA